MFYWIKKVFFHFIASMIAIVATDYVLDSFNIVADNFGFRLKVIIIVVVFLGVFNTFIKPILELLSLPFMFLSFGLFHLVINAFMLFILQMFIPEVEVIFWEGYVIVPFVLTVVNWIAHHIVHARKKVRD